MSGRGRAAAALLATVTSLAATPAAVGCELVIADHRGGRELHRLPLDAAMPMHEIAFMHSVLGTPVTDRYRWRAGPRGWVAELVEERFQGWGYGLPSSAAAGETLHRDGDTWVLSLARTVDPLVLRTLPELRMQVRVDGRAAVPMAALGASSVHLRVDRCAP